MVKANITNLANLKFFDTHIILLISSVLFINVTVFSINGPEPCLVITPSYIIHVPVSYWYFI
jgi:hypothetical protein